MSHPTFLSPQASKSGQEAAAVGDLVVDARDAHGHVGARARLCLAQAAARSHAQPLRNQQVRPFPSPCCPFLLYLVSLSVCVPYFPSLYLLSLSASFNRLSSPYLLFDVVLQTRGRRLDRVSMQCYFSRSDPQTKNSTHAPLHSSTPLVMVVTAEGMFYHYSLNLQDGGECVLLNKYRYVGRYFCGPLSHAALTRAFVCHLTRKCRCGEWDSARCSHCWQLCTI